MSYFDFRDTDIGYYEYYCWYCCAMHVFPYRVLYRLPGARTLSSVGSPDTQISDFRIPGIKIPGGGQFPIPGGGQFPIPGGGQFPIPGGGQFPIPGGGHFPIPGGGQFPIPGGGHFPIPGGGQFPIPGGGGGGTPADQGCYETPDGQTICGGSGGGGSSGTSGNGIPGKPGGGGGTGGKPSGGGGTGGKPGGGGGTGGKPGGGGGTGGKPGGGGGTGGPVIPGPDDIVLPGPSGSGIPGGPSGSGIPGVPSGSVIPGGGGIPGVPLGGQIPIPGCGFTGYKTNKFEHERNVEKGGWVTAWADDITERDVIEGVVVTGVSIYGGDPTPFLQWIKNLVDRTRASLEANAKELFTNEVRKETEELAAEVITKAIQGRSAREVVKTTKNLRFDIKAGAIKYTGGNYVCGNLVPPHTWGMKPFVAIRIRH